MLLLCSFLVMSCRHHEPEADLTSSAVLSPEGGVYKLDNGVTLIVPQGAVNAETKIEINYSDNVAQLGNEAKLSTDIYGLITCSPEGLVFEQPIEVHIPTTMPASDTTAIFLWDKEETAWTLTDFGLTEGNEIVFTVEHFSHYVAIPQEYLTLFDLFDKFIDIYVNNGETSSAELDAACERFCKEYLDEKLHFGEVKASETYENGNPQQTCIGICGYLARIIGQDEEGGAVYQGTGRYGKESNDGVIYNMTDRMLSEHWKNNKQDYSHQVRTRMINLYAQPVAIDLTADSESHSIAKGKTTNITIHTSCDGSVLPQQIVTLETNGIVQVEKSEVKTNNDGTITVSVVGKKEGTGIIKIKEISPADPTLVSETEVTIIVSDQSTSNRFHADIEEEWRIFLEDLYQFAEHDGYFAVVVVKSEIDYEYDKYGINYTITNAKVTDVSVKEIPEKDTIIQISQMESETYTDHSNIMAETPIDLTYSTDSYVPILTSEKKLMTLTRNISSNYYGTDGYNTSVSLYTWSGSVDFSIWMSFNIPDMDKEGTRVNERQYLSDSYIGMLGQTLKMTGNLAGSYSSFFNGEKIEERTFNQTPNLYGTMNTKSTITIKKVK